MTKEKGITLIALVITIIVLLILAGVSIATLIGTNGLLTKTNEAKYKTIEAEITEELKLAIENIKIQDTKSNSSLVLNKKKISSELRNLQICSADNAIKNENESNDEETLKNGEKLYISKRESKPNDLIAIVTLYINENTIDIKDITFSNETFSFLVDEVNIGSYVDYPVEYNNVMNINISELVGEYPNGLNGWRVIDKKGSGESGTVTLISAGVPLRMYHSATKPSEVLPILNDLYKNLPKKENNRWDYFSESGFKNKEFDLTKIFNTGYENKNSIHSFQAEEAIKLYNNIMKKNTTISELPNIKNVFNNREMLLNKYSIMKDLLCCGMTYWLATSNEKKQTELYDVYQEGFVYYNSYNNYGIRVVLELKAGLKTNTTYKGLKKENAYIMF